MKTAVVRVCGLFASVLVAGVAGAQSTQAVEWKVSEGGNGHWYRFVRNNSITWNTASAEAIAANGHLATITSRPENDFVFGYLVAVSGFKADPGGYMELRGPFVGGFQDRSAADYAEPRGGWRWVTGEAWSTSAWDDFGNGEPNNIGAGGAEDFLSIDRRSGICVWNDSPSNGYYSSGYLIEFDTDCNGDGIVDYGQILRGELADENSNGIPDICETSVSDVVPPSVPSQGGSTITIKGNNFPETVTVLVGGLPATNVVRVSATRITATSPALLPGMTSVTVNDFTLAEALYIRPECGSDLDQNGSVDAGDISIILLDFGPCYEPPAALAAPAPTPLLADEPAQKPTQR